MPTGEGEELPQEIVQSQTSLEISFSGPMPPPGVLAAYEEVLPETADRIISLMERTAEHNMQVEEQAVHETRRINERRYRLDIARLITGAGIAIVPITLGLVFGTPWPGVVGSAAFLGFSALSWLNRGSGAGTPNGTGTPVGP
jgi:uncharacterized membrane protein